MKLFQIEEPDGSPSESDGPGVAVGIDVSPTKGAAVAVAVGGNAELLPSPDGARRLPVSGVRSVDGRWDEAALLALLLRLRELAEKTLARPVTHAVVALDAPDAAAQQAVASAASAAGLTLLRLMSAADAAALARGAGPEEGAVLGAALAAEDDAAAQAMR